MRITALQPQVKDQERINIFVDDRFLLGVHGLIVLQMGLRVGQNLTPTQLAQLHEEEALQQGVERSLNFLSFRPRSRAEVRRYLLKKETPASLIDMIMERLDRLDLVNDQEFTSFWIESRERFNPKGVQAIKYELRQKGVDRDVIDEMVDGEQDDERALRAGRKKALSLANQPAMDFKTFRTRLGPFLQRRGFAYGVSTRAVQALWQELKDETVDDDDDDE